MKENFHAPIHCRAQHPGASTLSPDKLKDISAKSCEVIAGFGEPYNWITSYVAGDKIYCVHEASSANAIRRHSSQGDSLRIWSPRWRW